jgi:hypothetical protein
LRLDDTDHLDLTHIDEPVHDERAAQVPGRVKHYDANRLRDFTHWSQGRDFSGR